MYASVIGIQQGCWSFVPSLRWTEQLPPYPQPASFPWASLAWWRESKISLGWLYFPASVKEAVIYMDVCLIEVFGLQLYSVRLLINSFLPWGGGSVWSELSVPPCAQTNPNSWHSSSFSFSRIRITDLDHHTWIPWGSCTAMYVLTVPLSLWSLTWLLAFAVTQLGHGTLHHRMLRVGNHLFWVHTRHPQCVSSLRTSRAPW